MKILIALLLLISLTIKAQKNYPALIEQVVKAQFEVNDFNGAVLVTQHGKTIYEKAFGLANRELNVPNTPETKFQIGSITKQFTAAAILQLAEKNKLSLDDHLAKYFPGYPKGDSVTIHMLLNHTSGIKGYTEMPTFGNIWLLSYAPDSVISYFKNEPYLFSPGKQWSYSNSGYFLLGEIIAKASGESYSNYIMKNLMDKAGLKNTFLNQWDTILINRAEGYFKFPAGWVNAVHISMDFPYSAGAIISTVEDLNKWDKALFTGKIISDSMLTKMTTPYLNKYGYGFNIDSFLNHKYIGHSGGIPGFSSFKAYYPAEDIDIAVLSNNYLSDCFSIHGIVSAVLFDHEVTPTYKHKEVKIDSNILNNYVGRYQGPANILQLAVKNRKLFRVSAGAPDIELKPESDHKFFYTDGSDRQVNFVLKKDQSIQKAQLISSGVVWDLIKLD